MIKNLLNQSNSLYLAALILIAVLCLGSCTKIEISGNQIDMERVAQIKKGDGKSKVLSVMGSPTYIENTKELKYIYIQEKLIHRPIVAPVLTDLDIVTFIFKANETVKDIIISENMKANPDIDVLNKRTEIKGNEINPFYQMITNVGRYNGTKKSATGL